MTYRYDQRTYPSDWVGADLLFPSSPLPTASCLSCDMHTHAPTKNSSANFLLDPFVLQSFIIHTVLGMGMDMNVTAHCLPSDFLES